MNRQLFVDAGQSGIKVEYFLDGKRQSNWRLGPIFTNLPLAPQFLRAISELPAEYREFDSLFISSSGITEAQPLANEIRASFAFLENAFVVHDSVGSLVLNCGIGPAVVCAAGTGIVTLAVSDHGLARVDGWGHSMGDFGSGFWIGKKGLEAAMRFFDGRAGETKLLERLVERFGEPSRAYIAVQSDEAWVSLVAGFAKDVLELAAVDEIAAEILSEAASEITTSILTAASRVGLTSESQFKLALVGQVFGSQVLAEEVRSRVLTTHPQFEFVEKAGDLSGLAKLGDVSPEHPLWNQIGRS